MRLKGRKAQNILEYTMLLGAIIVTIVGLQIYVKRSVAGRFKQSADQIGEQFTTKEKNVIQSVSVSARKERTIAQITDLNNNWSQSTIALSNEAFVPSGANGAKQTYSGYEENRADYTDAAGNHAKFESGQLSTRALFDDD